MCEDECMLRLLHLWVPILFISSCHKDSYCAALLNTKSQIDNISDVGICTRHDGDDIPSYAPARILSFIAIAYGIVTIVIGEWRSLSPARPGSAVHHAHPLADQNRCHNGGGKDDSFNIY